MNTVIELPIGLDQLDKVFKVSDLLDNKEEMIKEFLPEVKKYLVRRDFFKGAFRISYNQMFDELIVSLIKKQMMNHFQDFTPEDIMLLGDKTFLKLIAADLFQQETYHGG